MDDADHIIDRARHGTGHAAGDRHLSTLVPVLDALSSGGLSYAMDWHTGTAFDNAATASNRLGAEDLEGLLVRAADIARQCRGLRLDREAAAFDDSFPFTSVGDRLRTAVDAHRRRHPDAFDPV